LKQFGTELPLIGTITAEAEVLKLRQNENSQVLEAKAFEHFAKKKTQGGCNE
jgi:hypothetical protein